MLHWTHELFLDDTALTTARRFLGVMSELLVLRELGIGIVWTVHNLVEHEKRYQRLEAALGRELVRHCDEVIVHCRRAVKLVAAAY